MEAAVPRVLGQAAARGLVSRADFTRAAVQAVIVADSPLAVHAGEAHCTATRRTACTDRVKSS